MREGGTGCPPGGRGNQAHARHPCDAAVEAWAAGAVGLVHRVHQYAQHGA